MPYEQFQSTHNDKTNNIFLINIKDEEHAYFSDMMQRGIHKMIQENKKTLIILDRKGYAPGLICSSCGHHPQCKQCDISIAYHYDHAHQPFGLCHICKTQYAISDTCSNCKKPDMSHYGIGLQQLQERVKNTYQITPHVITSDTVNSPNKIKKIQQNIDSPITIATSIVNFWPMTQPLDLVIIVHADAGLSTPHYTAHHQVFHFLHDTFTQLPCQNFIVQTKKPDHPVLRQACHLNSQAFKEADDLYRSNHNYPPFGEIALILFKHEKEKTLFSKVNKIYQELLYLKENYLKKNNLTHDIEIYSTPPLIYKIYNKYRFNIVIKGPHIRDFLTQAKDEIKIIQRGGKIDRQAREF